MLRPLGLLTLIAVVALMAPGGSPGALNALPVSAAPMNDRFGMDHISYGNGVFNANRYRHAVDAGIGWNRWVLYWHDVELTPGGYDFSKPDATVRADRAQGLKILGVLFGTPKWAVDEGFRLSSAQPEGEERFPRVGQKGWPAAPVSSSELKVSSTPPETRNPKLETAGFSPPQGPEAPTASLQADNPPEIVNSVLPPRGLYRPIFADGTDSPAAGKAINPENLWARFVQRTAIQYKGNVSAWEIWNEPDFMPSPRSGWFGFWAGGVDNFARMQKVAYLVIKSVDPTTTVVMGGMAFWVNPDFFPQLLQRIAADPIARQYGYYFDATAWHWYSRASQLYERTNWVKEELARFGIQGKQVWITETNLPVCGDSGTSAPVQCVPGNRRGNLDHQAAYVIQSIAYGFLAGVEKIFFFQLFDDELGPGEYYGFVRNNGTPRPALTTLKTATTYFSGLSQGYRTLSNAGRIEMMNFPAGAGQRLRVLWNTGPSAMAAGVPMEAPAFSLIEQNGRVSNSNVSPGTLYKLGLPAANLNDNPGGAPDYLVGGTPFVLHERGVPGGNGGIEGSVRDTKSQAVAGVRMAVGDHRATTDANGRYRVDVPPGLYDLSPTTVIPLSDPVYSVPVWSGRVSTQQHILRQLFQNFLPIGIYRARPVR